ncbi:MAG: ADP-ribosylglycohydrolase family protein [Planctomycetes bacterium]|nr:ADP-ribosylglycohydrolase family protein [Planctomycetota bacterium]
MRSDRLVSLAALALLGLSTAMPAADAFRRLPVKAYIDRMKAAWIGQMAGVGQGGPTEFRIKGKIMPAAMVPAWKPEMINQFNQDDIYVEMTFLRTLEQHGFDVSIRQAGIDFANSGYPLWHANAAGRGNLRNGIAPPDSGHPEFNKHADDIDYQIEADYSGIIAPGLPNTVIALGEKFGRLMNYGDGLYGGQFVGGMYAEAFFESDPEKIVRAGLACIPAGSQYAEAIRDLLAWHEKYPEDWEKSWTLLNDKYHLNPDYRRFSCSGPKGEFNIDAKLNGAYIVMGLLYGGSDPDRTIVISTRCGQDSDCNPSSAGGVLFTTIGYSKLPEAYTSALNPEGKFSHTPYNFPSLVAVCEKLVRTAVVRAGGRVEKDAAGEEVYVIPRQRPRPSKLEQCWEPGPPAGSVFTEEEKAEITAGRGADIRDAVKKFAPGWSVKDCGPDMDPGLREEWNGRENVLVTHPLNRTTGCVLSRKIDIPTGKRAVLTLTVGHHPDGDWDLIVRADGKEVLRKTVGKTTAKDGWLEVTTSINGAGKSTLIEIVNQPTGWSWEAGYFASIALEVR